MRGAAMRAYKRARLLRASLRPVRDWTGVRILGYHRIADSPEPLSVSPRAFRAQMEAVVESGATPIRLDAALDLLERPVNRRYICVTFDDGYRDNLEQAVPVLRELGIPATIYLPTRVIDGEASYWWYDDPPTALSWDEVDALVADGLVDFQPHTRTHPRLPQVDEERARDEIAGSKADLEGRGFPVTSFCYPAGLYGAREVRLVREAGYPVAVTTEPGVNAGGGDLLTLRRTLVYWDDDARSFGLKLRGALDRPPLLRRLLYRRLARARSDRSAAG